MFGPYAIDEDQVFYSTRLTMAIVNLKPIVPGHILVVPHRMAVRFADLTREEVCVPWVGSVDGMGANA